VNDGLQGMLNEACGLLVLSRHVCGVTDENYRKRLSGWPASRWSCEATISRIEFWKVTVNLTCSVDICQASCRTGRRRVNYLRAAFVQSVWTSED
jgi:hypothetical protein